MFRNVKVDLTHELGPMPGSVSPIKRQQLYHSRGNANYSSKNSDLIAADIPFEPSEGCDKLKPLYDYMNSDWGKKD